MSITQEQLERWKAMCEALELAELGGGTMTEFDLNRAIVKVFCGRDKWDDVVRWLKGAREALPILIEEVEQLTADIECYEGMKSGISVRISDLEAEVERLRGLLASSSG